MITHGEIWTAAKSRLSSRRYTSLSEIYSFVENLGIGADDLEPQSPSSRLPKWKRNVRNVLQYRRSTGEIEYRPDSMYRLTAQPVDTAIEQERTRRSNAWSSLIDRGGPIDVKPRLIRDLGMYGGYQRFFVDLKQTGHLGSSGATVGILHTGRYYPDDLLDDGIIYHYPQTRRAAARDRSEVEATKATKSLGLPVFVITPGTRSDLRTIRLGVVDSWSDVSREFLVLFQQRLNVEPESDEDRFSLTGRPEGRRAYTTVRGSDQERFRFQVLDRYGSQCAFCGVDRVNLLDAAHIRPRGKDGSYDPRNGLPACPTHNRAMDRKLVAIDPSTGRILVTQTTENLGITQSDINHLSARPHIDALNYLLREFHDSDSSGPTD